MDFSCWIYSTLSMEYHGNVWRVSEGCLGNVREVSGRCLVGVWKVSGMSQRCLVGFMRSHDRSGPNGIHDPQCFGPKFFYLFFWGSNFMLHFRFSVIFSISNISDLVVATLGSILDSQLSWESGKFQLARWSHEVVLFSVLNGWLAERQATRPTQC